MIRAPGTIRARSGRLLLENGANVDASIWTAGFIHAANALEDALQRYDALVSVRVRGRPRPRVKLRRNRMVPLLVRAGATIEARHADRSSYCKAVLDAGGLHVYERQHRSTLANILNRGTNRLPADVIPKIVDFWAHVGLYAIEHDRAPNAAEGRPDLVNAAEYWVAEDY